jgi:hypothetical protein
MRVLLGLAALAATVPGAPAQAQSFTTSAFGTANADSWVMTPPRAGNDRRRHHDVRVHRGIPAAAWAYGSGYNDYGDFDGNRSFDPDKWNDWWHDRPDRAYPQWMSRNQDCARRWYSGDVLTC